MVWRSCTYKPVLQKRPSKEMAAVAVHNLRPPCGLKGMTYLLIAP